MPETLSTRLGVEPLTARLRLPALAAGGGLGLLVLAWLISHGHAGLAGMLILAGPLVVYIVGAPIRGLELAILLTVLVPPQMTFGVAQLGVARLAAMLVAFAILLDLHVSPRVGRLTLVDWAVLGLVGFTLVMWAFEPPSPHSLRLASNYLLPFAFFAGGRRFGERASARLYGVLFYGAALASVTVLYEAFVAHRPLFTDSTSYYWLGSAIHIFRPGGVFGSPPAAAAVLAAVIPCAFVLLRRASGVRRLALVLLLATGLLALALTYTRGPEIGLGVGILVYAVLLGPAAWARYAYGLAIVAVATSIVLLPRIENTTWFQRGVLRHGTLASRQAFWHEATVVIQDSRQHELVGHGPNSLVVGLPWAEGRPQPDIGRFPDLTFQGLQNQYLRLLVELGVVGLVLFVGWVGGAMLKGARAAFRGAAARQEIAAAVAGSVAFCVTSLVGDTLREPQVFAVEALLTGIVVSLASRSSAAEGERR